MKGKVKMPLLNAKCPNCGADLKVDGDKDAAICEHCGSAFVVEKAIQNYNFTVTNNIAGNMNVVDTKADDLYIAAHKLEDQKMYGQSNEMYVRLEKEYPNDYRGWWGDYRTCGNGNFYSNNPCNLKYYTNIDTALALAPDEIKGQIMNDKIAVEEKLREYHQAHIIDLTNITIERLAEFISEDSLLDAQSEKKIM